MKQVFYVALFLTLLSCRKRQVIADSTISEKGSIQYTINGTRIKIDNANLLNGETVRFQKQVQSPVLPATRYLLNAQTGPDHFLTMSVVTDSLVESDYHYDSAFVNNNFSLFTFDLDDKGQFMSLYFATDNVDLHVSSNKNSRVSGTFKARFSIVTGSSSDYRTSGSIYITEGVFYNVPIIY